MAEALRIRAFEDADESAVVALWEQSGLTRPWNDPQKDIQRKKQLQRELFLVGALDGRIVATAMAGYEGHRGWVNYLAVEPALQRRGLARELMQEIERQLLALGCPKINIQIRKDNRVAIAFYERIGFSMDSALSMGKRLDHDGPRRPEPKARRADGMTRQLGLAPHPERGYYVETYRAPTNVTAPTHAGTRSASTAIYFLVTEDAPTTYLHRLLSDEIFHLYDGGPLEILRLYPDGSSDIARLGLDLEHGERPQVVIPAGTWFGTELVRPAAHCLVGCTVAPGFDFADFELDADANLSSRYPEHAAHIGRLLRPSK